MQPCFSIDQIEDPSCFFLPSVLHHSIDGLYWTCRVKILPGQRGGGRIICKSIKGRYAASSCTGLTMW